MVSKVLLHSPVMKSTIGTMFINTCYLHVKLGNLFTTGSITMKPGSVPGKRVHRQINDSELRRTVNPPFNNGNHRITKFLEC